MKNKPPILSSSTMSRNGMVATPAMEPRQTMDLPTALELLELDDLPETFDQLARRVAWHQPAAKPWSEAQTLAYRMAWQAVELRTDHLEATGRRNQQAKSSA